MERKILQQREVIRSANAEKRQERQDKNEAIRVKYGERVFFVFSLLFSINLIFFLFILHLSQGLKPKTYTQID
jgi:hypothetical protein